MNLYEKIRYMGNVPDSFDLKVEQLKDIRSSSHDAVDMIHTAYRFGFFQGIRSEEAGKAEALKRAKELNEGAIELVTMLAGLPEDDYQHEKAMASALFQNKRTKKIWERIFKDTERIRPKMLEKKKTG